VLAWQICAYNPIAVEPDALAVDVARLMLQHQVHHVVVMKDRELVGIVSSLDFVRLFVSREQGAA
jgi:CBS domain-containing protein